MSHFQRNDRVFFLDGQYVGKFGTIYYGFDEMQNLTALSEKERNKVSVNVDHIGYVITSPDDLVQVTEENNHIFIHTYMKLKMNWDNWDQPVWAWKANQYRIIDDLKDRLGINE